MKASTLYWIAGGATALLLLRVFMSEDQSPAPLKKTVKEYLPLARVAAQKHGLTPGLLLSFVEHESGGDAHATRFECCKKDADGHCIKGTNFGGRSPCPGDTQRHDKNGDPIVSRGLFQVLIGTGATLGASDPLSMYTPETAFDIGAKLLKQLSDRYDGDLYYIAAAYNGGAGGTDKHFRAKTAVPNDKYAKTALALYEKWKDVA